MTRGFYLMHRGWRDNPVFKRERMTEREAWVWMIERANFKEGVFYHNQRKYAIKRGQIATSIRDLIRTTGWGQQRVSGFLRKLKNEGMITTVPDTPFTLIQIENYDRYQGPTDTGMGTAADTQGNTNQKNVNKRPKNKNKEVPLPEWLNPQTWQDFVEHRQRLRKPMTPRAKELMVKKLEGFWNQGEDINRILEQSIEQGWQGVFSEKEENNGKINRGRTLTEIIAEQIASIE